MIFLCDTKLIFFFVKQMDKRCPSPISSQIKIKPKTDKLESRHTNSFSQIRSKTMPDLLGIDYSGDHGGQFSPLGLPITPGSDHGYDILTLQTPIRESR